MITKICGYYKLEAVKEINGVEFRRSLTDWFPNLITNIGMDRIATNYDYMNYCQVGTGSTAPSNSDVALVNRIAGTNTTQEFTYGVNSTSPYYTWNKKIYRFGLGAAAGNLSEVGIGWLSTGNLFSRALILDSYGNPTTITVLSDEYLDVTYEFRFYPEEADTTGTIVFTGNIGGSYNYTLRRANITTIVRLFGFTGYTYPVPMNNKKLNLYSTDAIINAYSGVIGSITGSPSGTSYEAAYTAMSFSTYVAGTYSLDCTIVANPTTWNVVGGIKSIAFHWGFNLHQMEFDNVIPKTDQDALSLTFRHIWARA